MRHLVDAGYGDFENVHRCGVLNAESRAGQYKHFDIENAAAHLHGMIDAKHGEHGSASARKYRQAHARRWVPAAAWVVRVLGDWRRCLTQHLVREFVWCFSALLHSYRAIDAYHGFWIAPLSKLRPRAAEGHLLLKRQAPTQQGPMLHVDIRYWRSFPGYRQVQWMNATMPAGRPTHHQRQQIGSRRPDATS
jgi:hypothetical protein